MRVVLPPDWWRRRRVWLPLLAILMLAVSAGVAWVRAGTTRIMIYNETGRTVSALRVTACGQQRTFDDIADGESVRFSLEPKGAASEARLFTNGVEFWHGDYVEPQSYRLSVYLTRTGNIEVSSTISWLRRPFGLSTDSVP